MPRGSTNVRRARLPGAAVAGGTTFNQGLDTTAPASATLERQVGKNVSATSTMAATFVRQAGKPLQFTATSTTTMPRQTGKPLSATVTKTATLSAVKVILRTFTANVTGTATADVLKG